MMVGGPLDKSKYQATLDSALMPDNCQITARYLLDDCSITALTACQPENYFTHKMLTLVTW